MMSVHQIERHFAAHRLDPLLEGLSANGLDLPLPLRIRLSQHPAGVVALGLRRLIELTYGPTSLSRGMTRQLLDQQEADGSFGNDPLATACVLAALLRVQSEHPQHGEPELDSAVERALVALAAMQTPAHDGEELAGFDFAHDRTLDDRALVAAFILFLLADNARFRSAVRFADLSRWFEQHAHRLDEETHRYWLMAHVGETGPRCPRRPSPHLAAIAA